MSSYSLVRPFIAKSVVLFVLSLGGCSDDSGASPGSGGTTGSGGTDTGGASTGGDGTGGDATGGTGTGGGTGGSATGGASTGGDATGGEGGEGTGGDGTGGEDGGDEFTLTSTALADMGVFAEINTCAGGMGAMGFGEAIPLEWSGFPEGTQSFALTMIDVTLADAQGGQNPHLGCHSAFWNVPVSTTSMPAGNWASALTGAQSIRDGYLGPCPNFGGGTNEDTYVFTLYAMGEATLSDSAINANAFGNINSCNAFRDALEEAALAKVTLTGTSSASNVP